MQNSIDRSTIVNYKLVRLNEAIQLTNFSRSSIWRGIREGTFPTPIRIGKRAIAFRFCELEKWIESRPRIQLNPTSKKGI